MPRKPRITAVPIEQEEGLVAATSEEKTEAEQLNDIINEVKEEPPEEPQEAVSDAVAEVKPKAKRASRAKPKEEPVVEEPREEPKEEPKEEQGVGAKVECPDCGKQMSAKTLKYSHGPNCVTPKPKESQPIIEREVATEELIEKRISNRRAERVTRREAMVQQLMQNAF